MKQIDSPTVLELIVVGPVLIKYDRIKGGLSKRIENFHAKQFWESDLAKKVKTKQGCYIFATKAGKGYTPCYIGRANGTMFQECFASHKLHRYN